MISSQWPSIFRTKLIAPKTNGIIADSDAPFSHQVFKIPMTQVESMVKPNSILNDFRWESVALDHF